MAQKLQKALPNQSLRVVTDLRNEKIAYKIREHSIPLPYILVAGDKEKAAGAVVVRARGNKDLGVMSVDALWVSRPRHHGQSLSKLFLWQVGLRAMR